MGHEVTLRDRVMSCPDCRGGLSSVDSGLTCSMCGRNYPVVNSIPILLGRDSVFDPEAVVASEGTYFAARSQTHWLRLRLRQLMPTLGTDRSSVAIDRQVNELLAGNRHDGPASGLVIGAGTRVGTFSQRFPNVEFLTTDVDVTYSPDAIADALALPIADQSIDLVVCEHVVEHVIDPLRAALEIERVLRPGGIALIKMPFLYPWHGGYIDFFRATPAGMIVLFAGCEVVHLGPGMGPGAAAAYALFDGGVEFFGNAHLRRLAVGILRVALSPLKWLDPFLTRRFQSVGGSAGITFIGRKTDERLSPQEMVATARRLGKRGLAGADRIPSPA